MSRKLLIIVLLSCLIICCEKDQISQPEDTPVEDKSFSPPNLRLVHLEKSIQNALRKPTQSTINFDSVFATKTLDYILINNGTAEARNVSFDANLIRIEPDSIGVIPGILDSSLLAYPIISFTIPHIIPIAGVGTFLPFEVGPFSDQIEISYSYEDEEGAIVDTTEIFPVLGIKFAVKTDMTFSGITIEDFAQRLIFGHSPFFAEGLVCNLGDSPDLSSVSITNNGNYPIDLMFTNPTRYENHSPPIDEVTVQPLQSYDMTLVFLQGLSIDGTRGDLFMKIGPSKCIIKFADMIFLGGDVKMSMVWFPE